MKLANLLRPITYSVRQGNDDLEIGKITHHSREAEKDTLFVCIKGAVTDGAFYVREAVEKGAVAILSDREVEVPKEITLILVENVRETLAKIAAVLWRAVQRNSYDRHYGDKGKDDNGIYDLPHIKECGI